MYINIYQVNTETWNTDKKPECKASYNDTDYFVVPGKSNFVIKGTIATPNKTYSLKRYFYQEEHFDAMAEPEKIKTFEQYARADINNATIDDYKLENQMSFDDIPQKNYIPIAKPKRKTSDKQLQHIKNYLKEKAEIKLWLEKDFKEEIKKHCKKNNISVNAYVLNLIRQDLDIKN